VKPKERPEDEEEKDLLDDGHDYRDERERDYDEFGLMRS